MSHPSIRGMNWSMDVMQQIRDAQHGETSTKRQQLEYLLTVAQGATQGKEGFPELLRRCEMRVEELAQTLTIWNFVEAIEIRINPLFEM